MRVVIMMMLLLRVRFERVLMFLWYCEFPECVLRYFQNLKAVEDCHRTLKSRRYHKTFEPNTNLRGKTLSKIFKLGDITSFRLFENDWTTQFSC